MSFFRRKSEAEKLAEIAEQKRKVSDFKEAFDFKNRAVPLTRAIEMVKEYGAENSEAFAAFMRDMEQRGLQENEIKTLWNEASTYQGGAYSNVSLEGGKVKRGATVGVLSNTYRRWYSGGFWTPRIGGFKVNIGKFLFAMLVMAGSLVIPFIFKESGSAWFLSMAISLWAIGTIFPSHVKEDEEEGGWGTGVLLMKASLNGSATIFLSLGLLAISPSTPFMRLVTLVVFTIAYLSFPTGGGDSKYKAYLASWRMFLGFYFIVFFILAFMNVLSVSPLIFLSLLMLAFAFYFNLPDLEVAENIGKSKPFMIVNKIAGGENPGGMIVFGIMMMVVGASMALFLGNMKFLFFSTYTWATLAYFGGIMMLLMGSASGSSGETVLFSGIASVGLAIGAFDLWIEHHYFAAMGYNILVGMSVASGAASQQARPIIGVTALSFAVIILTSAYPAVLGEAVFGAWWPQVEGGVTTLVGPMTGVTEQMQESFQNAFLMFSCPSCYYEKQLQQQQANADVKSGGTVKGIEVSDFTFQVVNIPEQPLLATATLENKGEFTASNIQAKLKSLQTKSKKGTYTTQDGVTREFVTCSGTKPSETNPDECSWKDASYSGDMKQITFRYGYTKDPNINPWASLGSCSCYTSDGKQKGVCQQGSTDKTSPDYDPTGCRLCKTVSLTGTEMIREGTTSTTSSCDRTSRDTVGYDYGGSSVAVGFDYSFDYIVNVSLDLQLIQPQTLNDLLLKKQITLRETRADFSGGPVQASIWTQKQPVRAGEDTLAVISLKNSGTGTVKVKENTPTKCSEAKGICRLEGISSRLDTVPIIGDCNFGERKIGKLDCPTKTVGEYYCCVPESLKESLTCEGVGGKCRDPEVKDPIPYVGLTWVNDCLSNEIRLDKYNEGCGITAIRGSQKVCCVPSTYNAISGKASDYTLTIPFISGIKPKITEISKGGLDCGDVFYDGAKAGKDVKDNGDSFELHCALTSDLGKAAIARYAFLFNYDIPKDIDRKSVIFVGNANYQYQSSKTMETQITWAPPQ